MKKVARFEIRNSSGELLVTCGEKIYYDVETVEKLNKILRKAGLYFAISESEREKSKILTEIEEED